MLAVSSLLVLSACKGGSNAPSSPGIPNTAPASGASSSDYAAVPQSAPNGIRTFIHVPLRNEAELENLVAQQSTEGSPEYHRWLTPAQFRQTFGPRIEDLRSAALAVRSAGFTAQITSQGIIADAPQPVIEKTFNVHVRRAASVTAPGLTTLVSDRAPTLPAALTKLNAQLVGIGSTHESMPLAVRA
ncbi:MAG: hypothetical protein JOZ01_03910, partial [Candidatus Eremiobacteraeota bacterium]|nr:hypothetical protein [Candidatus Eremiobacteraeota bacterium]